jgi:hypothetical protein
MPVNRVYIKEHFTAQKNGAPCADSNSLSVKKKLYSPASHTLHNATPEGHIS